MTTHEKLVAKWSKCEFGIKQRVFNDDMPQTSVQYILSNPNYGKKKGSEGEEKMLWLIDRIDFHAQEVLNEIEVVYNEINSID
jgi:hypothetical protein